MGRKALSPAANQCVSHHAVHGEVAVLGLQLHSMGVVVADLCVACQEQTLVVHDPVEHLRHDDKYTHREKISIKKSKHRHTRAAFITNSCRLLQEQAQTAGTEPCGQT